MTLLAKSPRGLRQFPLDRHLVETETCAIALFGEGSRWAQAWRRFFRLTGVHEEQFLPTLRVAALAHDLGKANDGFQAMMMAGRRAPAQVLRHEHLSALVLVLPEVEAWLARSARVDSDVVCAAVLSHHAKATHGEGPYQWGQLHHTRRAELFLDDPSLTEVLRAIARVAEIEGPVPALPSGPTDLQDYAPQFRAGCQRARRFRVALRSDPGRRALLLAVKAGLMVADAAASGLAREGLDLDHWFSPVVGAPDVTRTEIEQSIIGPRIAAIEARTQRSFAKKPFQLRVADRSDRCLLVAGCGAGKTLAAWAWAASQADRRRTGRVVFLYPTRGTATEGFRDYVGHAPEADRALVHGTAAFELERMTSNPDDPEGGADSQSQARLFALQHWPRRFYSATVDQFLSFLEHGFDSTCLLPVLADALVIVDEVHAFDARMFADLCTFLRTFDVPVLCMTATLPRSRVDALVGTGLELVSAEQLGVTIESESHDRYRLERRAADEAAALVHQSWRDGLRVLWVVNTVARCQEAADALAAAGVPTEDLHVYHSRFTLDDRQQAHARTVAAFAAPPAGTPPRAVVAVTTQVCEMSLDLDADVLVTEVAPCSSLVQRFGRCNRHHPPTRGLTFHGRLIVVEVPSEAPYATEELDAARRFLDALATEPQLTQEVLSRRLAELAPAERQPVDEAMFLEAGWFAVERPFRESSEPSRSAVLPADLPSVVAARRSGTPIDGRVLPAPIRLTEDAPGLPRWLSVLRADAVYDSRRGLSMTEVRRG